ncbi:MAG TPA: immunity protein YezG family protein [Tepidisphaeraceae bacterium]|jgi:hypothetical protein|nr:immunity protein YezG family protein [Tepidisphaeraceae bacterium]
MIEGIEPFYQQIGESIQGAISEPWQRAAVEAIFFPQSSKYLGEYFTAENAPPKGFPVDLKVIQSFRGLRELFKNAGKPLWCRARFELHSDGKFTMNWGYDDCDENGFAPFDEAKESERMRQARMRQGLAS